MTSSLFSIFFYYSKNVCYTSCFMTKITPTAHFRSEITGVGKFAPPQRWGCPGISDGARNYFGGGKPNRSEAKVRPSEARESQAKRDVDRAKRGSKQLGFVGRCKPPNGVQGQRPGKFWDFSPSRCPEIAIPACFQWITDSNLEEREKIGGGAIVGKI